MLEKFLAAFRMRAAVKRFYLENGVAIREVGECCCPLVAVARDAGAYVGDCSRLDYVAAANFLLLRQEIALVVACAADGDCDVDGFPSGVIREVRRRLLEAAGLSGQ